MLVPMLLVGVFMGPDAFTYQRPRPVSQEEAREAIAAWCQQYPLPRHDFMSLMSSEMHPSLDFIGADNQDAYKEMVFPLLTEGDKGNLSWRVYNNLRNPKRLYNVLKNKILTNDELDAIGLSSEKVREVLNDGGREKLLEIAKFPSRVTVANGVGTFTMQNINLHAYFLACLEAFGCLDFVDADAMAKDIVANQISRDRKWFTGTKEVNAEKAAGLFHFGKCDLRATRGALWSLQILEKLDMVDKEACLEGILRFHKGKGRFKADYRSNGIYIHGNENDTFNALESLAILDGLERIGDFHRWRFKPETSSRKKDGKMQWRVVTSEAVISWAYQLRLEELRGG